GLIIGLGIAVAVALVITKGASPFTDRSNKMGRPADLEPSQASDPNKPLYGNRAPVPQAPPSAPTPAPAAPRQQPDSDPLGAAIAGMQEPRPNAAPVPAAPVNTAAP